MAWNQIRHIATSYGGSIFAVAEFKRAVQIWCLAKNSLISAFEATLDFGGSRLAISSDGNSCVAGAYQIHGITCYEAASGRERWRRKDIKRVQNICFSPDDRQLFCGIEGRRMHVLNASTGETIQ